MKFILLTLAAFTISFSGNSQDSLVGIQFETGTWAEVVAIAKKQNKPIFVDAYTTWCGPCKWMAKTTFKEEEVGDFVSKNFVAYKMDMEKGEGIEFAKTNEIRYYPTLLFFNSNGEQIHRGIGAKTPELFLELCRTALNPEEQLATYKKRYARGKSDKEFLLKYINSHLKAAESVDEAFDKYWGVLTPEEKYTAENLTIMRTITRGYKNPDHKLFVLVQNNKAQFINAIGEDEFSPFWAGAYKNSVLSAAREKYGKDRKVKLSQAKSIFTDYAHEIDELYELTMAKFSRDEKKIRVASAAYVAVTTDWEFLNSEAWTIYENSDEKGELEKALTWVNKSVALNYNYNNLDTKGAILFKLNRLEEAQTTLEEAVKEVDDTIADESINSTEKMLREIIMSLQEKE